MKLGPLLGVENIDVDELILQLPSTQPATVCEPLAPLLIKVALAIHAGAEPPCVVALTVDDLASSIPKRASERLRVNRLRAAIDFAAVGGIIRDDLTAAA